MAVLRILHYQVLRQLGRGGMGEVYLAKDTRLERFVALKLMSVEAAKKTGLRSRFNSEARAASALNHPNICTIHEVGESDDGRPFLAMEYVDGTTLELAMAQRRFTSGEILDIALQIADGLDAAHSRHLLHRDVKPANLMLNKRAQIKILDFGLAKSVLCSSSNESDCDLSQTQTGMLLGTPHYMSPEQVLGRDLDLRSDIFSLGVVLYELVAGRKPFLSQTIGETINNIVNRPPDPFTLAQSSESIRLQKVVLKCLRKEPSERYESCNELVNDLTSLKSEFKSTESDQSFLEPVAKTEPCVPKAPSTKLWQLAEKSKSPATLSLAIVSATVLLIALVAFYLNQQPQSSVPKKGMDGLAATLSTNQQRSIAVLPFDNFNGDPETEYLSDGLTEEITAELSRVQGLKVVARNSSFVFKGQKKEVRKIGETLHVNSVLDGSVRKVGKQLRVTVTLINVADGFDLWSETYDRNIADILAVQEDIARRIAERLQAGSQNTAARKNSVSPEAYKLFLQAMQQWNKRTESSLQKAVQLYQQAIDQEPSYAAAYGGLAATYFLIPMYSFGVRTSDYLPLARAAANHALELDPACPQAHAVLGSMLADSHDYAAAEEHFLQALRADPNYATGHHWYGRYLYCHGRMDEGLNELRTAIELDPLSPIIRSTIPAWFLVNGDSDRAIVEIEKVLRQFPEFHHPRILLVEAYLLKGDFNRALAELDKAREVMQEQTHGLSEFRAYALARSGREQEARKILASLEDQQLKGKPVEVSIAIVRLGLKDYEHAIDALEHLNATEGLDMEILVDPLLRELRALPRFQSLLVKAGLKKESKA